jgi:hypothetical protein
MIDRVLNPQAQKPNDVLSPVVDMRTGQRKYATAKEIVSDNNKSNEGQQYLVPLETYDPEGYASWYRSIQKYAVKKQQPQQG